MPSVRCHCWIVLGLWISSFVALIPPGLAQDQAPATLPAQDVVESDERVTATAPENRPVTDRKQKSKEKLEKATKALSAVVGIAVLGIATIAGVMIGAKYLRRIARDVGPVQRTIGNDFWFIKPPKPHPTDDEHIETHRPTHLPPESESKE